MAHIEQAEHLRRDLVAYRDRIQALVDHLDQGLSCAELLYTVQDCYY